MKTEFENDPYVQAYLYRSSPEGLAFHKNTMKVIEDILKGQKQEGEEESPESGDNHVPQSFPNAMEEHHAEINPIEISNLHDNSTPAVPDDFPSHSPAKKKQESIGETGVISTRITSIIGAVCMLLVAAIIQNQFSVEPLTRAIIIGVCAFLGALSGLLVKYRIMSAFTYIGAVSMLLYSLCLTEQILTDRPATRLVVVGVSMYLGSWLGKLIK